MKTVSVYEPSNQVTVYDGGATVEVTSVLPTGNWTWGTMPTQISTVADGNAWKTQYTTGTAGAVNSITASWNGAAFDYATSTFHIVAAGGHGDSWNNQCYSLRLAILEAWKRTANQTPFPPDQHVAGYAPVERYTGLPTLGTGYQADGHSPTIPWVNSATVYWDGKPCSRHIYGGTFWLPAQQRVLLMNGATFPGGASDAYCGWFDPVAGIWTRKNNTPRLDPGRVGGCYGNKVIYCASGTSFVYAYDPATDAHTRINTAAGDPLGGGVGGPYLQACVAGDYLYATVKGGWLANNPNLPQTYANAIIRMQLNGVGLQKWVPVTVTGDTTGMYGISPGMEYDPDRNALVFWSAGDPGNLSILTLADMKIARTPISGTAPAVTDTTSGVWGRFRRYAPNSYALITSAQHPVNLITLQ